MAMDTYTHMWGGGEPGCGKCCRYGVIVTLDEREVDCPECLEELAAEDATYEGSR